MKKRERQLVHVRLPLIDDPRAGVRIGSRLALALGIAGAALVVVAVLEWHLLDPYHFPAFAAIVLSAAIAGVRYGILTTAMFGVGYAYWFLEPRRQLAIEDPNEVSALVAFALTGTLVAGIGGTLRLLYARLRTEHYLLDRTVAQREDLLRALTHDVRSPLNVISMNAALLAGGEDASPEVRRRAALIQRSVVSIDAMLGDLVKVVALESGKVALQRSAVELRPLLIQVRESLANARATERVEIAVPPGLPRLHADPQRLERVLVNLVSNALKYSEGPVVVGAASQDDQVIVSVRDRGPGIGPEDLPHLFEKYWRAKRTQKREGLGLGLYISRLIVEAHGGRIWAESQLGAGSTFHVAIPAR